MIETKSEQHCYGGVQGFYHHESASTGTEMGFAVYLPPQARSSRVPVLYYLAGLTCTEETAPIKAGAQAHASRLGLALVMPDTSPRGAGIDGEEDDWDFGTGAGFYVDAVTPGWRSHYRMESYVVDELRSLIEEQFPVAPERTGVFGHSMGGHGAVTLALRHPEVYRSVSAFAPICAPTRCPWGVKAFTGYLGDSDSWPAHDAVALIDSGHRQSKILVDQGEADQFLAEQLNPHLLSQACESSGQALELRMHAGYDHSYYFIQTFVADHLEHHASVL